jgi:hypothetical protein
VSVRSKTNKEGETSMKVPKVIECYLKRCNNTDCTYNQDGDCHWGIVFHVRECHSYTPKICPNCGAEIEWIDKARGIWSCPKCGACPAGLEFE